MSPAIQNQNRQGNTIYELYSVQIGFNHWHMKRWGVDAGWGGKELIILVGEMISLQAPGADRLQQAGHWYSRCIDSVHESLYGQKRVNVCYNIMQKNYFRSCIKIVFEKM